MSHPASARVLFVVAAAEQHASTMVRVRQFYSSLAAMGIETSELAYTSAAAERWYGRLIAGPRRIRPRVTRELVRGLLHLARRVDAAFRQVQLALLAERVDAVFVQWVLPPVWLIRWLRWRKVKLIYDFDDAVFLHDPRRAEAIVVAAWRVVAGSHFNLEYALRHNPASALVPSSVPVERYATGPATPRDDRAVRIGWIGGPATLTYLGLVAEPLRRLAARGVPATLLIAGSRDRPDLLPDFGAMHVELVPWYSGADLPALVARLDIGLMPLEDGPWERGKCAMKALVYMAGGCPAVCSPVGETTYVIEHGVTGFLAAASEDWEAILSRLAVDADLRREVGARGRVSVGERYSSRVCFERLNQHVFAPLVARTG